MSGGIESAGDIATGLIWAQTFEPIAGSTAIDGTPPLCLNCDTLLRGPFCHRCGQNRNIRNSVLSIGADLIQALFNFEGKMWRTVPLLVTRPGSLTRRYIAGERARFVSPLALFLFLVFLMVAVIHWFAGDLDVSKLDLGQRQALAKIEQQIDSDMQKRTDVLQARTAGLAAHRDTKALDQQIAGLDEELKGQQKAKTVVASATRKFQFTDLKTGWAPLDEGIAKANADPSFAIYKLQSSAYEYAWALIPISVPFVAMLFLWRRRFGLYDHAIFVTYSLDFMMLLITGYTVLKGLGTNDAISGCLLAVAPPIHMYKQLRGAYALRRFSAFWRLCALLVFATIALTAFAVLLLAMGLME